MKKIGNRPITKADTDFSKLQKNEIKNKKIKEKSENFLENFWDFFLFFYFLFHFFAVWKNRFLLR